MQIRSLLMLLATFGAAAQAEPPASVLGNHIVAVGGEAVVLAAADPNATEVISEATEIARLEKLPAVAIPVQDETLAGAITTIAAASAMNFIAPTAEDFPERITLNTKVSPWHLLNRLGERYRFSMLYRDGIWEFNRDAVGALVAKVYVLKHTNLDIYRTSQNSFSTIGSTAALGGASGGEAGMVFSAQTQKMIEDIRDLIGLPGANIVVEEKAGSAEEKRPSVSKSGEAAAESGKIGPKVIYISDANALYVVCTRAQHEVVGGYIHLVDQPPRQVHIEARFFETSWDPKTILGINPENFQPRVSLTQIAGNVSLSRLASDGERAVLSVSDVSLQMNALQSDASTRLVQNPKVVTANNHEVYFSVGDEEPFVSSNNIYPGVPNGGFGSTTASVSIRRIGTSVNVVPTVFAGEGGGKRRIRLVVRIEVGALKGFRQVNTINIPVVSSQKYEYTTYVEDNQALAFGGLSGIGEIDGVTKVPVAGDVPVVGYLFKSKSREIHQRNLVGYIIARVVDDPEPAALPELRLRDPRAAAHAHATCPQ
jgi:type II secretory pathway component GspD/PulD (secretin)